MSARVKVSSGWLQGKTVRKGSGAPTNPALQNVRSASNTRPTTPSTSANGATSSIFGSGFGGGVKDASGRVSEFFSMDDQCPVCKSDRYLNPKLRILVSSCYHKMCESCIDRLFTLGPAPCPSPGCTKVLRKLAFIPQTFEDLGVEKEVAIRRRVAKEFNKRREDFPDLRSFNDYLEEVEDITFNLINEVNLPETEARILANRAENAALMEINMQREEAYAQALREQEDGERREREMRAQELRREEEEEREAREKEKRQIIDRLETSEKDARKVVAKSRAEALKRSTARASSSANVSSAAATSRALRNRAAQNAIPDPPHVPIQDDYYAYEDAFVLQAVYNDRMSEAVRKDREGIMRAGGYRVEEAWERAIRSAVAGLDVPPPGTDQVMGYA